MPALCLTDRTDPNRPAARRTSPGYNVVDGGLVVRCRVAPEPSNQERRAFGDRLYQEPAVVSISAAGGALSEYITVTPASAGSTVATVTCYKPFTGNIIITVTTRQNGYQASCIVSYQGAPSDIVINTSVVQENGDYIVGIGADSQFTVTLTNPLGAVGSQFNDVTCEVNGVGFLIVGYMERYNSSGNTNWYDTSDETITLDSIKDALISVSYSNGKLTVTSIKSIESYYERTSRLDSGRTTAYHNKFRSFVDDCYFQVTIRENTSGLSKVIDIRFSDEVVTGVSVNSSEMVF